MTTIDQEAVGLRGREPAGSPEPGSAALRRSAAIRLAVAVAVSGALTAAAIVALWQPLRAKGDVVGYPIFAAFNPYNYWYAYILIVALFPVGALLIFLGLTRLWPRLGLATPHSRGPLRPMSDSGRVDPSLDAEHSPAAYGWIACAARVVLVGAVLGLQVGVASTHVWKSVFLVALGYLLLVALAAEVLGWVRGARSLSELPVATVNALGAPLTVAGLSLVSAHTEVQVISSHLVHHYRWFPVWLGVPLALAAWGWILISLRRGGRARAAVIERRSLLLIVVPVALFVVVAHLPGDLGQIGLFEEGQSVVETVLVGHGWLPWRDVVVTHGLLADVAPTAVGWGLFGNSYWAALAGITLIFYPLAIIATYWLLAYLVGRSWPLLLIAALIFFDTWLGTSDPRFLLWPLVLLLLAALLKRHTRPRAIGLGLLAVAQAIVTPEIAPSVLIIAAVVAAYEWYGHPPAVPLRHAFQRTVWLVGTIAISSCVFVIYMASRGALGDVIYVTVALTAGHFDVAIPLTPSGVSSAKFAFIALAPLVALLISFAYAVVRLRLRRPFLLADWPMAAVALYVLFYYSKFLARMDAPHAYEPFMLATPLMVYIVYRVVGAADRWIRARVPDTRVRWLTAHPAGIAFLIFFVVYFWSPLHWTVGSAPAEFRPSAPNPPVARVGYAAQYDSAAVADLQRIVNAYLGPHGRLLDLTDEPALFYYFLNRDPASRWYAPNGIAYTPQLQRNLIAELRRSPPKLIILDDTDSKMYGLPAMDGIPVDVELYLVSRWVLQHYRPLLESHGRTIYALPGVPTVSRLHLQLQQQPVTAGVPFLGQGCNWGDAPTFLTGPAEPPRGAQSVTVRAVLAHQPEVTLTGWAGDLRAREPVKQVIATFNGRILARTTPDLARPDVTAAGYPAGFLRSGFSLSIPTWADATQALRILLIGRDGSVSELGLPNAPVHGRTAGIGGRTVVLQPTADTGHVDGETAPSRVLAVQPPAGSTWSDFGWLEVDAPIFGGFLPGGFALSNQSDFTDPGHIIAFSTIATSPRRYVIPVSSCAQWQGYGSSRLFLKSMPLQEIGGVRLIR